MLSNRCLSTIGKFTSPMSSRPLKISPIFLGCWNSVKLIGHIITCSVGVGKVQNHELDGGKRGSQRGPPLVGPSRQ
jgi:hypothetical protein